MQKIRFGIIGTGNIAHRFANAIQNVREAELVAVASRASENAHRFATEFHIPNAFGSYASMAQSDCIDAAYIAVPHSLHKECSILMMEHGKHVLCEKPMAVNGAQGREMFACARKNHVFLMEAMWARLVPGTGKLLDLIQSGVLGTIKAVEGRFCYALDEDELDHHVLKPAHGGGALLDVGVYGLHFSSWVLGTDVTHLSADADLFGGVDRHTAVQLRYESGAIAQLSSAVLLRKPTEGFVYGTEGYVHMNRFYAPEQLDIFLNNGTESSIPTPYSGNGFEEQIRHVCACIREGRTESPLITPDSTLTVLDQMDTIRQKIGVSYPQDSQP